MQCKGKCGDHYGLLHRTQRHLRRDLQRGGSKPCNVRQNLVPNTLAMLRGCLFTHAWSCRRRFAEHSGRLGEPALRSRSWKSCPAEDTGRRLNNVERGALVRCKICTHAKIRQFGFGEGTPPGGTLNYYPWSRERVCGTRIASKSGRRRMLVRGEARDGLLGLSASCSSASEVGHGEKAADGVPIR